VEMKKHRGRPQKKTEAKKKKKQTKGRRKQDSLR